ncbi:MAG TPA: ABC transporter ATP-binding protein [Longimicrobium sp.]|jgi:ABC-2 type transport system ATP-binding protein|uniref:ABC transporter ATP-binding protein n=1 Tax=Longimicrobium sp. TaxID=2029185 RepID=UPI002EDB7E44
MGIVEARGLSHRYGRRNALLDVDLEVPEGALYALLGPNGAGKTTLLQILMGIRRPTSGSVALFGKDASRLSVEERGAITYVAEGQPLPGWMTLRQLEAYLAPLYPRWDPSLAADLRSRFGLEPDQKIRTLSRGQRIKAAVLCALAPRPRLLLLDEPFTGMDVMVKDELVRGLLQSAGDEGCTIVISSHDIGELEALADWVGFLDGGRLTLSVPMDTLRERLKRVDVVTRSGAVAPAAFPAEWLSVERAGPRISFLLSGAERGGDAGNDLRRWFPEPARIEVREASLREIFVALARGNAETRTEEVAS